jgi:hypothetical protein
LGGSGYDELLEERIRMDEENKLSQLRERISALYKKRQEQVASMPGLSEQLDKVRSS